MRLPFAALGVSLALLGGPAVGADGPAGESPWSLHVQSTYQLQGHGGFDAPYEGRNSFQDRKETRGSFTATLFLGRRLWDGGEICVDGELLAGQGVSSVLGLAGPPNGETYRVDSPDLKASLARLFLRQTFSFGERTVAIPDDDNRVAGLASPRRLVLTAGKFSLTDVFDANAYSHDPRTQFNNWSLWANAAWDYPADTRGYTWAIAVEGYLDAWRLRVATAMVPTEANGITFDHDVRNAHGEAFELEHVHVVEGLPGAARLLAFVNHADMGSYREAVQEDPAAPDVTSTRRAGSRKWGLGLNLEQALSADVGLFLRAGWNDGKTESWAFTEVERTFALGVSAAGAAWGRGADRVGVAAAFNGLSGDHHAYLGAGGYGFMLGDSRISYAAESVVDVYYSFAPIPEASVTVEVQRFSNLGANGDRGPVTVLGGRLHVHF